MVALREDEATVNVPSYLQLKTKWEAYTPEQQEEELLKCAASYFYFIMTYVHIYSSVFKDWVPFTLWPSQARALRTIATHQLSVALKARQLGMTWLALAYALWLMLFRPRAVVLLFSRRDDEATYLLDDRLKGIYQRLPSWMQAAQVLTDNSHNLELSNGSEARAFPTTAGDSYTSTFALVDEADLVEDLGRLLNSVKPTIDMGGQLLLLSRADKSKPQSLFKQIYRAAKAGLNRYAPIFLPWHAHPDRTQAWYDAEVANALANTTVLDDVHEQYPATDEEALAPRTLDKRIPPGWIRKCYVEMKPLVVVGADGAGDLPDDCPAITGLRVYRLPEPGVRYVIGADPAEGNPTSDDSALRVIRTDTGEEVAALNGKFEISVFGGHCDKLAGWYNQAQVLVERNNHGHAVLLWLTDNSRCTLLRGLDNKPGWLDNTKGKTQLYDNAADIFKDGGCIVHDFQTMTQLQSIEGASLKAPGGEMDDCADAFALALAYDLVKVHIGSVVVLDDGRGGW